MVTLTDQLVVTLTDQLVVTLTDQLVVTLTDQLVVTLTDQLVVTLTDQLVVTLTDQLVVTLTDQLVVLFCSCYLCIFVTTSIFCVFAVILVHVFNTCIILLYFCGDKLVELRSLYAIRIMSESWVKIWNCKTGLTSTPGRMCAF